MTVSTNIRLRRLELGLTQQQLAEAAGYQSRSAIAKIESGANEVPLGRLLPLAKALDMTVDRLLDGFDGDTDTISDAPKTIKINQPSFRSAAVILAGGKSTRNLQNIPNQFISVLGKPVIGYCLTTYQHHPMIDDIFVVCLDAFKDVLAAYAKQYKISKLREIISAGETGVLSARNGFNEARRYGFTNSDIIVFQESTRPLVSDESITRLLNHARETGIAITGELMSDNVQFFRSDDGGYNYIDRDKVVDLQSPDAYRVSLLCKAFEQADAENHNYAESNIGMFLHNLGFQIDFCFGSPNNVKIVRQEDISVVTALLKRMD